MGDAGVTAARIQRVYGNCDYGVVSTNCAQLGYNARAIAGFCTVIHGNQCRQFTASNYLTDEGEIAQEGDYGLCFRNGQYGTPFDGFQRHIRNGCFRFVAQIPEDFGAQDAVAEVAAMRR